MNRHDPTNQSVQSVHISIIITEKIFQQIVPPLLLPEYRLIESLWDILYFSHATLIYITFSQKACHERIFKYLQPDKMHDVHYLLVVNKNYLYFNFQKRIQTALKKRRASSFK